MKLVVKSGPGQVEVAYMWLPTFIGLDAAFMQRLENEVMPKLQGKELTEETLSEAHELVLDKICEHHPIPGLRDYLDALKFVEG